MAKAVLHLRRTSRSLKPAEQCLQDMRSADVYIGIFAWRSLARRSGTREAQALIGGAVPVAKTSEYTPRDTCSPTWYGIEWQRLP
jgi:hypothetical protein